MAGLILQFCDPLGERASKKVLRAFLPCALNVVAYVSELFAALNGALERMRVCMVIVQDKGLLVKIPSIPQAIYVQYKSSSNE